MSDDDVVYNGSTSTSGSEGVSVSVHPLPLLNISEHFTRVRIQAQRDDVKGEDGLQCADSSQSRLESSLTYCVAPAHPCLQSLELSLAPSKVAISRSSTRSSWPCLRTAKSSTMTSSSPDRISVSVPSLALGLPTENTSADVLVSLNL